MSNEKWKVWSDIIMSLNRSWKVKESQVAQPCPTLCDLIDCSLPCSFVHGIFQARVLEWVAISFSRGSSQPSDQTQLSHIAGRHFTVWATMEAKLRRHIISTRVISKK